MSGHSKWSTIKRQKGTTDIKRGKTFTKIANAITIAVKQGGGITDASQNPKLRLAVEMARTSNMPKENIERAIERAAAKGESEVSEVIYEGFAPGGVFVLVEAVTDNTNRTTSEVKSLFNKSGARFAEPGSVSYMFKQVGEITVRKNGKSLDDIFLIAADSGAEDVEDREDGVIVYTDPLMVSKVKESIASQGLEVISAEISRKPVSFVDVEEDTREKIINFLSTLESMDDVLKVYSNVSVN